MDHNKAIELIKEAKVLNPDARLGDIMELTQKMAAARAAAGGSDGESDMQGTFIVKDSYVYTFPG